MHKLAIITAVAPDRADHLHETAQSVAQTRNHLNIQWIVVWDGVSTQPVEHADAQLTTGKLCSGASVARNTALPTVEAEYLLKLDADDVLNPEGVAATIHQLEKNPDAGWAAANMLIHGTGERTEHWANTQKPTPKAPLPGSGPCPSRYTPAPSSTAPTAYSKPQAGPPSTAPKTWGCSYTSQKTPKGCGYPTYSSTTANGTPKKASKNTPPQREEQALKTIRATINARRGRTGREPVYFRTR